MTNTGSASGHSCGGPDRQELPLRFADEDQFTSAIIRQAGGKMASADSCNTDYLLAGEGAGSKLDKARELGVAIVDEAGFLKLVHGD